METAELILTGIVSTSVMTLFSYVYARLRFSVFKEPELLNILIRNSSKIPFTPGRNSALGWVLHYTIGMIFVWIFDLLLQAGLITFSMAISVVYGISIGVIGVFAWLLMFALSNNPPRIRYGEFFVHLLLAHLLFAVSMGLIYLGDYLG
ncbi:hypothetical protein [Sinomicrobium soli]|uniref:hypothetical protein n=1 Tax=Sinomicrobium sp. N-1-3-6 TaxID=2219864 RepID=UPI000DCEFBAF|nr:hypothetical protein [Sinomicrobium sp. N-1-3-6]RAV28632.1 hypothetical protein DN748_11785 [Sinomicrobium sp. N-1-3-6]